MFANNETVLIRFDNGMVFLRASVVATFIIWASSPTQQWLVQALSAPSSSSSASSLSRRSFVATAAKTTAAASTVSFGRPAAAAAASASVVADNDQTKQESPPREIVRLLTGVQYADVRVGRGPPVEKKGAVVMHLRALLRDGSVLFDTVEDGNGVPMLYQMGSVVGDFGFFSTTDSSSSSSSSKRPKIVPGVEDAILSRGNNKKNGSSGVMNEGGIRMVVVPAALAYGSTGVSRFDAFQMGLRKPVPRDEILRYEVELLRCLEVEIPNGDGRTGQACCPEQLFPCNTTAPF